MSSLSEKRWTVMVYFAADNDLDRFAIKNLKQMMQVGSSAEVNLLAQIDLRNPFIKTKRYRFQKNTGGITALEDHVVETLPGETNTGAPENLCDFIIWGGKKFPAKHYLVVLWGHGTGTDDREDCRATVPLLKRAFLVTPVVAKPANLVKLDDDFNKAAAEAGRLLGPKAKKFIGSEFDDNPIDFLNNHELQSALEQATEKLSHKIDVLGMDACLMSMAEVAFQVRGNVDFMIASEETEPSDSWPYDTILKKLVDNHAMTPEQLSSTVVEDYIAFYIKNAKPGELNNLRVTQSACDLRKFDELVKAISKLGQLLKTNLSQAKVRKALNRARRRTQAYYFKDYIDLFHFCQNLPEDLSDENFEGAELFRVACQQVMDAIVKKRFVVSSKASRNLEGSSHGLSIYFPAISSCYSSLDFAGQTEWGGFLHDYASTMLRSGLLEISDNGNNPTATVAPAPLRQHEPLKVEASKINAGEVEKMKNNSEELNLECLEIELPVGSRLIGASGKKMDLGSGATILVPAQDDLAIKLPSKSFVSEPSGAEIKVSQGTSTKVPQGTSTKVTGNGARVDVERGSAIELPEGTFLKMPEGTSVRLIRFDKGARLELQEEESLVMPEGTRLVKAKDGKGAGGTRKPDSGGISDLETFNDAHDSEEGVNQLKRVIADLYIENARLKEELQKRG